MINYMLIHLWPLFFFSPLTFFFFFQLCLIFPCSSCNNQHNYFSSTEFTPGWIHSIYSKLCGRGREIALRTTAYENVIIISMDNYNKWLVWNFHRIGTEVNYSNLSPSSTHHTPSAALLFYPWPLRMFSGSVTASWLRSWEVSKMHFLEMGKSNWISQPTKTKQKE